MTNYVGINDKFFWGDLSTLGKMSYTWLKVLNVMHCTLRLHDKFALPTDPTIGGYKNNFLVCLGNHNDNFLLPARYNFPKALYPNLTIWGDEL